MPSHAYHDILPGFDPDQIWYDGCQECEERGANVSHGIGTLDHNNFQRAWLRAIEWNSRGLANISGAERELLETLWAVYCQQDTARRLNMLQLADISSWENNE